MQPACATEPSSAEARGRWLAPFRATPGGISTHLRGQLGQAGGTTLNPVGSVVSYLPTRAQKFVSPETGSTTAKIRASRLGGCFTLSAALGLLSPLGRQCEGQVSRLRADTAPPPVTIASTFCWPIPRPSVVGDAPNTQAKACCAVVLQIACVGSVYQKATWTISLDSSSAQLCMTIIGIPGEVEIATTPLAAPVFADPIERPCLTDSIRSGPSPSGDQLGRPPQSISLAITVSQQVYVIFSYQLTIMLSSALRATVNDAF